MASPTLTSLIATDSACRDEAALEYNFGDGFLYRENPIFRNIRELFLGLGYGFTREDWCGYGVFKLACLGEMLAARKVIVVDNGAMVRKVDSARPGRFRLEELRRIGLTRNQLLHECTHAVGDWLLGDTSGLEPRRRAFAQLFGESFASATEAVANYFVVGYEHLAFFSLNSYVCFRAELRRALAAAVTSFGTAAVLRLMVLAYLHANFLYLKVDDRDLKRSLELAGIVAREGGREWRELRRLFRAGLELNLNFRTLTAQFYLNYIGLPGDIVDILDFDFLALVERDVASLRCMGELAEAGTRSAAYLARDPSNTRALRSA